MANENNSKKTKLETLLENADGLTDEEKGTLKEILSEIRADTQFTSSKLQSSYNAGYNDEIQMRARGQKKIRKYQESLEKIEMAIAQLGESKVNSEIKKEKLSYLQELVKRYNDIKRVKLNKSKREYPNFDE